MMRSQLSLAGAILAATVLQPAHAYLDPGTGSILLQGLIAAVAAVTVGVRIYFSKIRGLFRSQKATPVPERDEREESKLSSAP